MALLKTSITVSLAVILIFLFGKAIDKKYNALWRYFTWLLLCVVLLIPFRINNPNAPIVITPEPQTVVIRTDRFVPIGIDYSQNAGHYVNTEPNSANHAPVIDLYDLIKLIWVLGAVISFFIPIFQYIIFRIRLKLKKTDCSFTKTPVYSAKDIVSPMLIGFFKPIILIPENDYTDEDLEIIILHEDMHKKRGDLWYKLLLLLVKSLHWFNPLIYFMIHQAQRDLEYSCDFLVCKNKDMYFRKKYSMVILKSMKREE